MTHLIVKPWGSELIYERNDKYMFKRLEMVRDEMCSLQYHEKKIETILVLSGTLEIQIEDEKKEYIAGTFVTIQPGVVHRMRAVTDCLYLEASTPELDDVVRVEDEYGRV